MTFYVLYTECTVFEIFKVKIVTTGNFSLFFFVLYFLLDNSNQIQTITPKIKEDRKSKFLRLN